MYTCRLVYDGLIGGALAFRTTHFVQVNGFGNKFFGWGGEDDDMWQRYLVDRLLYVASVTKSREARG